MPNGLKKLIKFFKEKDNYRNLNFVRYHFFKFAQKYLVKFNIIKKNDLARKDTFNWSLYNIHYRGEVKKTSASWAITLNRDDYGFENGRLFRKDGSIKPLNEQWRLLYETILQLAPASIMEIGCGNGAHLYNMNILNPNIGLIGLDLSDKQIEYLHETYPGLGADIRQADATLPFEEGKLPTADATFTMAVIMHIHENNSHEQALCNLFNSSNKYVLLVERWRNHNIMADVKKLCENKLINWNDIYFYFRTSEEDKNANVMICSKRPLDYPVLETYDMLPQN
jgi:hypothetical protein